MCVAFLAWQAHPDYRVVLASNRDEVLWRKARPLHMWETEPPIVAGQDVTGGGTWVGADGTGRFALVTNIREGLPRSKSDQPHRSRGLLITDYLQSTRTAADWTQSVVSDDAQYKPFNLIVGDRDNCFYLTSRPTLHASEISKGIHGLSNGRLNEPWPKVADGLEQFTASVRADVDETGFVQQCFDCLADSTTADPNRLPDTGVGRLLERRLSSRFVKLGFYGTRSSTLLRITTDGRVEVTEKRFGWLGRPTGKTTVRLTGVAGRAS